MGILSRKLDMQEMARNLNSSNGGASAGMTGITQGGGTNFESSYMSRCPFMNDRKKIIV